MFAFKGESRHAGGFRDEPRSASTSTGEWGVMGRVVGGEGGKEQIVATLQFSLAPLPTFRPPNIGSCAH